MLTFATACTVVNINAAEKAGSSLVSAIILTLALTSLVGYQLLSLLFMTTVFKSYCATLRKWCQTLKDQPKLLETHGLCTYLKALQMADDVLSDLVFHFSIGASLSLLVSLYRAYSLGIGKINSKFKISWNKVFV